jgi:hypothetical protein
MQALFEKHLVVIAGAEYSKSASDITETDTAKYMLTKEALAKIGSAQSYS